MTDKSAPASPIRRTMPGPAGLIPFAAVAVVAAVFVLVGVAMWLRYVAPQTHVEPGRPVQIRVKQGESTLAIGESLQSAGVIANGEGFALRTQLAGAANELKPGVYGLSTGMSYAEAIRRLQAGPTTDRVWVTIPEGFRLDQIASRFHDEAGVSKSDFLELARHGAPVFSEKHPVLAGAYRDSLEGYLFPKTYEVARGATAETVIGMMLDQFDRETADLDFGKAERLGVSPRQVVVIASMIERESKLDRERPLVSAVIYNRLRRRMRLKIDATIEYVLRDHKLRLTNADLSTKSPYNTYLHEGLPPGPISSPGIKSLSAAAAPADSQFLYYVLTGRDGSHTFTTNLADFLVAKRKSKEVFGR
jgi:UPF0755 protein